MDAPQFIKPIPDQVVNERAGFPTFDLKQFMAPLDEIIETRFIAELDNGDPLPTGMICTSDGLLTGIPARETAGSYAIVLKVENAAGRAETRFKLLIKETLVATSNDVLDALKAQVWEAIDKNISIPDLMEAMNREISITEIYYLLERWGSIKIWDAFNLDSPSEKQLMDLPNISPHYAAYDRGSCLVAIPKDLFSHERTLADGLQTARALAREAFNRNWTLELVGLDKFTRIAWIEIQKLNHIYGKSIEVLNYNPTPHDIKLYNKGIIPGIGPQPE